jgi:tight adherence protein B
MFVVVTFLIFSAALLAASYYAFIFPQQREAGILADRLRQVRARAGPARSRPPADLLLKQRRGAFGVASDALSCVSPLARLQQILDQANLTYRAGDVVIVSILVAAAVFGAQTLLRMNGLFLRILISVIAGGLPLAYVVRRRRQRLAQFEEAFPDTIDLFNRVMRAGHNIHAGLETLAGETADPIRMEFKKVVEELSLGSQMEAALHSLGRRIPLVDLKFFITSLVLQRQTGANVVSVLENLSALVRERLSLAAKLRAATTQQRFSAGLLCILPIVVGIGFWIIKPDYIQMLYKDPTGSKFLTYGVVSEIIGILIIRRISNMKL